ncbi:MAG TPA: hypothetical protein VGD81_14975 [Opitutaceae bacterium]
MLIAATLSVFVLAGVLSAFLFVGRTGFLASSYSDLETEVRRGLDLFADDVRMASGISWNSAQSVTLQLPDAMGGTTRVTYAYDTERNSPTHRCFYRMEGDAASREPRRVLVHNAEDFAFKRYKLEQPGVLDNTAANDLETKQIQITLRAVRQGATTAATTNSVVSARYVLRNKRVSN